MASARFIGPCVFFLAFACSSNDTTGAHVASGGGSGGAGASGGAPGGGGGTGGAAGGASGGASGSGGASTGCSFQAGTSGTLLRGRVLLPTGPVTGEVLIDKTGKIACADPSCAQTPGYADATRIDCGTSAVIAPGLINAHDHTEYDVGAPLAVGKARYDHRNGWRTGAGGATPLPSVSKTTDPNLLAAAELRFVLGGTTSINGSGGIAGLSRNVAAYKNPAWTEGLSGGTTFFDTFPLGDSNGVELTSGCGYPSIRSASSTASSPAYTPHVAEGVNLAAENELSCLSQPSNDLITAKTGIIHAVGVNAKDVDAIAIAGAKLIWSPRSNIELYGNTAPISLMKRLGVSIALGSDWMATGSMNMLRELACADALNRDYFHGTLTDRELVDAVTQNAALAIGFDQELGKLAPGYFADVSVFANGGTNEYRSVIEAGVEDVLLVLRGGQPLFGDADLVAALSPSCAALDVCGSAKQVCIDTPNETLSAIQGAVANTYPLFFCKGQAPSGEPSCVPYRVDYPNGITQSDKDGDGVDNAKDDCPDIFDPARPMDGAGQSDVDGDGVGDACDAAPLDPKQH